MPQGQGKALATGALEFEIKALDALFWLIEHGKVLQIAVIIEFLAYSDPFRADFGPDHQGLAALVYDHNDRGDEDYQDEEEIRAQAQED